jgi:hypothetical protein
MHFVSLDIVGSPLFMQYRNANAPGAFFFQVFFTKTIAHDEGAKKR